MAHRDRGEPWQANPLMFQATRRSVMTGRCFRDASNVTASSIRSATVSKATSLDPNGMPLADVPLERVAGGVKIVLPPGALYVCLR